MSWLFVGRQVALCMLPRALNNLTLTERLALRQLVQRAPRHFIPRSNPKHFPEFPNRLVHSVLVCQSKRQVHVGQREVGLEANSLSVMSNGLLNLASTRQGKAQIVVHIRGVRLETQRFVVLSDCLVKFALARQGNPEVGVRF